jgi:hypothetical protein|tara:strand:- start:420 stop:806 length:387 start_codon:yes stop_codon:yes gene_type:complete
MSDEEKIEEEQPVEEAPIAEELMPKKPSRLCPRGIQTFTVARQADETGISGEGVVIEGVLLATGQCIAHWLYPRPRGSIAVFDSMNDFITVHIKPHPGNRTIITYDDGEQERYGLVIDEEKANENNEV